VQPQVVELVAVGQGDPDFPDFFLDGIQPLQQFRQLCSGGSYRMLDVNCVEFVVVLRKYSSSRKHEAIFMI
jgi:hypothetical protein